MKVQLLIDSNGPEIRHRTSVTTSDPFFYIKMEDGVEHAYFHETDLEAKRAEIERGGLPVKAMSLDRFWEKYDRKSGIDPDHYFLQEILREANATEVEISDSLPYKWILSLQRSGIKISVHDYARERRKKTAREVELMKRVQLVTEQAFHRVKDILHESSIIGNELHWRYEALTSETLKYEIASIFLRENCSTPEGMIVASGVQGSRPHDMGSGTLLPHQLIVVDLFPRDNTTGYFADMTRTFCKGKPMDDMRRMYDAVRQVQESSIHSIMSGISGRVVYDNAVQEFEKLGFPKGGSGRGFIHGIGHGLGLGLHEAPNLAEKLLPGDVVTVEPGLYYPEIGGVRIEDVLVIHESGAVENITNFSKELVIP